MTKQRQSEVDSKFLLVLAEEKNPKGFWYYEALYKPIKKKLSEQFEKPKLSMSQVWTAKNNLRQEGFIEVKPPQKIQGRGNPKGQPKEQCDLTIWGLLRVLNMILLENLPKSQMDLKKELEKIAENPDSEKLRQQLFKELLQEMVTRSKRPLEKIVENASSEKLEQMLLLELRACAKKPLKEIAKHHAEKLLLLKIWCYLTDNELEEKIIERMQKYFLYTPEGHFNKSLEVLDCEVLKRSFEKDVTNQFYDEIFLFFPMCDFFPEEIMKKYVKLLASDPDVKEHIRKRLKSLRENNNQEIAWLVAKKEFFENLT